MTATGSNNAPLATHSWIDDRHVNTSLGKIRYRLRPEKTSLTQILRCNIVANVNQTCNGRDTGNHTLDDTDVGISEAEVGK